MVRSATRPKVEAVALSVASPGSRLLPDSLSNTSANILALERFLGGLMWPDTVSSCDLPCFDAATLEQTPLLSFAELSWRTTSRIQAPWC